MLKKKYFAQKFILYFATNLSVLRARHGLNKVLELKMVLNDSMVWWTKYEYIEYVFIANFYFELALHN